MNRLATRALILLFGWNILLLWYMAIGAIEAGIQCGEDLNQLWYK